MNRFTLTEDDFRHLCAGGTLEVKTDGGERVQLALADIGYHRMNHVCAAVGFEKENKVGRVREVSDG